MSKKTKAKLAVDYVVLTNAIAGAALSRRAALHNELAVGLIHFTQENGGTDTTGKANLKAVYNGAGYTCLTKQDRDYKTVNRRLNAVAKLFDKIGSSVVHGWIEGEIDTAHALEKVQSELLPFGFDTMDDVQDYIGVASNRTPRQPTGPKETAANDEEEGEGAAPAPVAQAAELDRATIIAAIKASMNAEEIREFCTELLTHVAELEIASAPVLKAA